VQDTLRARERLDLVDRHHTGTSGAASELTGVANDVRVALSARHWVMYGNIRPVV